VNFVISWRGIPRPFKVSDCPRDTVHESSSHTLGSKVNDFNGCRLSRLGHRSLQL
jgi:hypothetical protein